MNPGEAGGFKLKAPEPLTTAEAESWIGSRVHDVYGSNLGRLEDVISFAEEPRWLVLREGRFSGRKVAVPCKDVIGSPGNVWAPYERHAVHDSPDLPDSAELSPALLRRLERHYFGAAARLNQPG
jgi:hypothetical protein